MGQSVCCNHYDQDIFRAVQPLHNNLTDKSESYMFVSGAQVHERSIESDLALESIHQLMASSKALKNLKLVLMSATADIDSFKKHFA